MSKDKDIRILYRGQCIDNQDPLRLGRIRAIPKTDNQTNNKDANEFVEWEYNDPFLYLPLIPFFVQSPPKQVEKTTQKNATVHRPNVPPKHVQKGIWYGQKIGWCDYSQYAPPPTTIAAV